VLLAGFVVVLFLVVALVTMLDVVATFVRTPMRMATVVSPLEAGRMEVRWTMGAAFAIEARPVFAMMLDVPSEVCGTRTTEPTHFSLLMARMLTLPVAAMMCSEMLAMSAVTAMRKVLRPMLAVVEMPVSPFAVAVEAMRERP
jgi:hypothetical protein